MYSCPGERPERMFQRSRPPVASFSADEHLYIRYLAVSWIDGRLSHTGINAFPNKVEQTSVNRGSFSEPEDVLFSEDGKYAKHGVLRFQVSEIPSPVAGEPSSLVFEFWPKHVPLELNYSHSEIWSRRSGLTSEYDKPPASVRTKFRIMLSQILTADRICICACGH